MIITINTHLLLFYISEKWKKNGKWETIEREGGCGYEKGGKNNDVMST